MPATDRTDPAAGAPETLAAAVRRLTATFRGAGLETPERDARLLVTEIAGCSSAALITEPQRTVPAEIAGRLEEAQRRRLDREPVARILGRRGFYGREFVVTPATLDPRPDTETIVEAALALAGPEGWRDRPIRILDIGTGTGAIVVTLLAEWPNARGLGTDIDPAALTVARINAERLGVADRATWQVAASLAGIVGPFDLLVSNPPYIPSADIAGLAPEVARFDPRGALDGGPDGLAVYREILAGASAVVPGGWVLLEVGFDQAADVLQIAATHGLWQPAIFRDLAGVARCVAVKSQL
jgi:release factor glutamine methyltransferase